MSALTSVDNSDLSIRQALNVIQSTYGRAVSVHEKKKNLLKFGRTANADAGVKTTVANFQGAVVNETYATTNSIDFIISSSASDTELIEVEGHYFDSDNNFVFLKQLVTLTGQTAAPLTTALCRASRIKVMPATIESPASDLAGIVALYDATVAAGTTGGVPNVATATKLCTIVGENQSSKCSTSLASDDLWIITGVYATGRRATPQAVIVDIEVEYRQLGGVWLPLGLELDLRTSVIPAFSLQISPYKIIGPNTDIRMVAISDSANTAVSGFINGYLAKVVG